eukprot:TRINITY_DN30467_c0_g1_i1.p1 TRINITY_DN30467_c0_g1~~TRINITY_DN30467_c0_g1_i1.p1  ORF type:complete len:1197 (-),score=178.39 TRINITY_DN30467_c0_g1_i1:179-3769(-)
MSEKKALVEKKERETYAQKLLREENLFRDVFPWIGEELEYDETPMPSPAAPGRATARVRDSLHDRRQSKRPGEGDPKMAISAVQVATSHGVPDTTLLAELQKEMEQERSFLTMPITAALVFAFCLTVLVHDPVVPINSVEEALKLDIVDNANWAFTSDAQGHKDIGDVSVGEEFWDWFLDGFIPLTFQQERGFSEFFEMENLTEAHLGIVERADRGSFLHHNQLVGGIRVRQEKSYKEDSRCEWTTMELQEHYEDQCIGKGIYWKDPDIPWGFMADNPVKEFWLYIQDDIDSVTEIVEQIRDDGWLELETEKIEVAMFVYNEERGVHSWIITNFYLSRGGQVWKQIISLSTFAEWYSAWYMGIPDLCWVSLLTSLTYAEFSHARHVLKTQGFVTDVIVSLSIRAVTSTFGLGLVIAFCMRFWGTLQIADQLKVVMATNSTATPELFKAHVSQYANLLEYEGKALWLFRVLAGFYPIVALPLFFKAFAAQPRMAVVTRALEKSIVDLLHFGLVFLSIFLAFAVAGGILWGMKLDYFATLTRAMLSVFLIMLGAFEYDELESAGRVEACIWFFSCQIGLGLLLLNLLLAMVLEAYTAVATESKHAPSLIQETRETVKHASGVYTGHLVAHRELYRKIVDAREYLTVANRNDRRKSASMALTASWNMQLLSEDDSPPPDKLYRLVTVSKLQELVENLRVSQATSIVSRAVEAYHKQHFVPWSQAILLHEVEVISYQLGQYKKIVKQELQSNEEAEEPAEGTLFLQQINACLVEVALLRHDPKRTPRLASKGDLMDRDIEMEAYFPADAIEDGSDVFNVDHTDVYLERQARQEMRGELLRHIDRGQETVQESLDSINELEWRLAREKEQRDKVFNKMLVVKERMQELASENEQMLHTMDNMGKPIADMAWCRNEIFEVAQAMEIENQKLRLALKGFGTADGARGRPPMLPYTDAVSRAEGTLHQLLLRQPKNIPQFPDLPPPKGKVAAATETPAAGTAAAADSGAAQKGNALAALMFPHMRIPVSAPKPALYEEGLTRVSPLTKMADTFVAQMQSPRNQRMGERSEDPDPNPDQTAVDASATLQVVSTRSERLASKQSAWSAAPLSSVDFPLQGQQPLPTMVGLNRKVSVSELSDVEMTSVYDDEAPRPPPQRRPLTPRQQLDYSPDRGSSTSKEFNDQVVRPPTWTPRELPIQEGDILE